ncbi:HAMP domain-containing histidine kinase, partial [Myxococcota bacterium]|nr:HAMP domain-containing histidine kinase [Myxococcota bacterium]
DPTVWVSLELCEAVCEALARDRNDPALFERAGRNSFSPKYMGALRPIIRAFGNPAFAYDQMVGSLPRFNKVGAIAVLERGPGKRTLEYRTLEGAPREHGPYICAARRGQMAALPTLFDLPPATVEHPACMQRGAPTCIYTVTWREPRRSGLQAIATASIAAATGGAAALFAGAAPPLAAVSAGVLGLLAWSLRRSFVLGRELQDRVQDLVAHNDALLVTTQANEARVLALVEAKQGVEDVVAERTRALRETSERLEEALARVQALGEARSRFFANVSHELRTPLQLILAPLQDLVQGRQPLGGTARALETMARSAARLRELIDQLLDLARLDAGRVSLDRQPTSPTELVAGVVSMFSLAAQSQDVALETVLPRHAPTVALDRTWIEGAVSNLVSNALRVSPRGKKITISLEVDERWVSITVADEGPGMAEPARMLGRFAQGQESRGGAGLGLAIVEETVRLHGGDVSVESEPGKGTSFTMRIPRIVRVDGAAPTTTGRTHTAPLTQAVEQAKQLEVTASAASDEHPPTGPSESSPLALVVEDEDDLRRYVAELVATRCRVSTA